MEITVFSTCFSVLNSNGSFNWQHLFKFLKNFIYNSWEFRMDFVNLSFHELIIYLLSFILNLITSPTFSNYSFQHHLFVEIYQIWISVHHLSKYGIFFSLSLKLAVDISFRMYMHSELLGISILICVFVCTCVCVRCYHGNLWISHLLSHFSLNHSC